MIFNIGGFSYLMGGNYVTTGWIIFTTVILTLIIYSALAVFVIALTVKNTQDEYVYVPFMSSFNIKQRRHYIASQLNTKVDYIEYIGNNEYQDKRNKKIYNFHSFIGIQAIDKEKEMPVKKEALHFYLPVVKEKQKQAEESKETVMKK